MKKEHASISEYSELLGKFGDGDKAMLEWLVGQLLSSITKKSEELLCKHPGVKFCDRLPDELTELIKMDLLDVIEETWEQDKRLPLTTVFMNVLEAFTLNQIYDAFVENFMVDIRKAVETFETGKKGEILGELFRAVEKSTGFKNIEQGRGEGERN